MWLIRLKILINYTLFNDISDLKIWKGNNQNRKFVNIDYKNKIFELSEKTIKQIEQFKLWMQQRRYSDNTIKSYIEALVSFLVFYKDKQIEEIDNKDIVHFNSEFIIKNKLSLSYQNQLINALKLFYNTITNKKLIIENILRPRYSRKLPNVLSKDEIEKILKATQNLKHKAILSLIYSCGLRRSELLNLEIKDIDSKRNLLIIRNAKGRKDRLVPLSVKTLDLLRNYYKQYKTKKYLFEGYIEGEQYSAESLQNILWRSVKKAGINKAVTLHWLRHSYATHLLEAGTDLRYIQEILGHKSSKTTEIYTHVSTNMLQKIKSPFDDMDIEQNIE